MDDVGPMGVAYFAAFGLRLGLASVFGGHLLIAQVLGNDPGQGAVQFRPVWI